MRQHGFILPVVCASGLALVGAGIAPGTFLIEPDLAERWEAPDDMTYVFHLRKGVKWHNKPPSTAAS
jgi:ABC-type transport system substrate-binding protein